MMAVPPVNEIKDHKRKIKRNVRRNTLIAVGLVTGVGVWYLVKQMHDLQEDVTLHTEAINDLIEYTFLSGELQGEVDA